MFQWTKKESDYEKWISNNLDSQLFWFNVHASFWDIPSGLFEHTYFAILSDVCSVAYNRNQQSAMSGFGLQFSMLTADPQHAVSNKDWFVLKVFLKRKKFTLSVIKLFVDTAVWQKKLRVLN